MRFLHSRLIVLLRWRLLVVNHGNRGISLLSTEPPLISYSLHTFPSANVRLDGQQHLLEMLTEFFCANVETFKRSMRLTIKHVLRIVIGQHGFTVGAPWEIYKPSSYLHYSPQKVSGLTLHTKHYNLYCANILVKPSQQRTTTRVRQFLVGLTFPVVNSWIGALRSCGDRCFLVDGEIVLYHAHRCLHQKETSNI